MKVVGDNLDAFPDLKVTIENQIAEGGMVVTQYTARGCSMGCTGMFSRPESWCPTQ